MHDLIVRDVEDSEISVIFEVRNLSQGIVRDVEFFQIGEGGEARDFG